MRCRDFWILCFVLLSVLFTILTLIPGSKTGLLPNVAIATFSYSLNSTAVWPPQTNCSTSWCYSPFQLAYPTIHEFFFTVHYLGLCAGYMGGTENEEYNHLTCQPKKLGWKFRSDDPFIVDFGMIDGIRPVAGLDVVNHQMEIETVRPGVTLLIGLVVAALVTVGFTVEIFGMGTWVGLDLDTGVAALMGVAATFLMLSSALVTHLWVTGHWYPYGQTVSIYWTTHLIALSWSAMGFMYVAFIGKVVDKVRRKEKEGGC